MSTWRATAAFVEAPLAAIVGRSLTQRAKSSAFALIAQLLLVLRRSGDFLK